MNIGAFFAVVFGVAIVVALVVGANIDDTEQQQTQPQQVVVQVAPAAASAASAPPAGQPAEPSFEEEVNKRIAEILKQREAFAKKWEARCANEEITTEFLAEMRAEIADITRNAAEFLDWMSAKLKENITAFEEIAKEKAAEEAIDALVKEEQATMKLAREATAEQLIQNIKSDDDFALRLRSMKALRKLNEKQAVEPLIELLKNDDWRVRASAAYTLSFMQDKRAVPPLIELLKDGDENVRRNACGALITLTSQVLGEDYEAWKQWHESQDPQTTNN